MTVDGIDDSLIKSKIDCSPDRLLINIYYKMSLSKQNQILSKLRFDWKNEICLMLDKNPKIINWSDLLKMGFCSEGSKCCLKFQCVFRHWTEEDLCLAQLCPCSNKRKCAKLGHKKMIKNDSQMAEDHRKKIIGEIVDCLMARRSWASFHLLMSISGSFIPQFMFKGWNMQRYFYLHQNLICRQCGRTQSHLCAWIHNTMEICLYGVSCVNPQCTRKHLSLEDTMTKMIKFLVAGFEYFERNFTKIRNMESFQRMEQSAYSQDEKVNDLREEDDKLGDPADDRDHQFRRGGPAVGGVRVVYKPEKV